MVKEIWNLFFGPRRYQAFLSGISGGVYNYPDGGTAFGSYTTIRRAKTSSFFDCVVDKQDNIIVWTKARGYCNIPIDENGREINEYSIR